MLTKTVKKVAKIVADKEKLTLAQVTEIIMLYFKMMREKFSEFEKEDESTHNVMRLPSIGLFRIRKNLKNYINEKN